jgi:predicted transcriptional regulator YdeE
MAEPSEVYREAIRVVGVSLRTTNAAEARPASARIPGLWRRVLADRVPDRIPGRKEPGVLVAVYANYETDHHGPYTILVGAEVEAAAPVPAPLAAVAVPASRCLLFEARGPMPAALLAAWGRVWSYFEGRGTRARSYTADIEVHRGPEAADLYVAVR